MKRILFLVVFALGINAAFSQSAKALYFELGGPGLTSFRQMRTTILIFILLISSVFSFSQVQPLKREKYIQTHIFGEGAGPAISASLNYERIFWRGNSGVGLCLGAGMVPFPGSAAITVPAGINFFHGKKHFYELGAGVTALFFTSGSSNDELMAYSLIGYRRIFLDGSVIGRIFFSPFFAKKESTLAGNFDLNGRFIPYGGISFGIALSKKNR